MEVNNLKSIKMESKRPIEQIINEGKAMLAAKDNEIQYISDVKNEYIEVLSKLIDYKRSENEGLIERNNKLYLRQYNFDKTLRRQYIEKNELKTKLSLSENTGKVLESKVKELKDNCNTYVSKIQDQHREIEELRIIAKDLDDYVMSFGKERESLNLEIRDERHNKYLVMGAAVITFIGFLIAWYI